MKPLQFWGNIGSISIQHCKWTFFFSFQEFTGSHWSLLWFWESKHQCALYVICRGCDHRRRRVHPSRYPVYKNVEDTKYRYIWETSSWFLVFILVSDSPPPILSKIISFLVAAFFFDIIESRGTSGFRGASQYGHSSGILGMKSKISGTLKATEPLI